MALSARQTAIVLALKALEGEASTREIAEKTGMDANAISQTLGKMSGSGGITKCLGGYRGSIRWKLNIDPFFTAPNKKTLR